MRLCTSVWAHWTVRKVQNNMLNPTATHEPCAQVTIREVQYHMLGYGHTVWEAGGLPLVRLLTIAMGLFCYCNRRLLRLL